MYSEGTENAEDADCVSLFVSHINNHDTSVVPRTCSDFCYFTDTLFILS